ncbi:MAG: hypothetical protein F6J94_28175 [Moorea sp. SIO1F2]|uniref:substrate-binding domain-containing protein n=1 Tax=Moorena sp. SIO1F2 TaxID=2607819 RepID=UPI0013B9CE9A|nr:substrate-binding domain-containing protein [Moorena sp. SIO1F2]NET85630.1 hypothetical protein [Moorena sp. SIO1F2]
MALKTRNLLGLVLALAFMAAACATDSSQDGTAASGDAAAEGSADGCAAGNIIVSGSSTVEPVSRKAAELYEDICADAIITVDGPGTGDGFKLFCAGETDVSDASRQIKDSEIETCEANGVSDLKSGKLDKLIARSEADIATNQVKELNEILDDT